ncbi:MAG: hypothetical protein ACKOXB_12310 [Flavobacteriales bacterium]
MKKVLFGIGVLFLFSCSEDKTRHEFHYIITGDYKEAKNLYGEMGPGIKFDAATIAIPFEVMHEVYGNNLQYLLRIEDTDTSHHYHVKVFIDDQLIKESSTYDMTNNPPRISVSGTFVE